LFVEPFARRRPYTLQWTWQLDVTEAEAVDAARAGSTAGLEFLLAEHRPRALSVAYSITRDVASAEEAVAEAFLKAYRYMDRFDPDRRFGPWFLKIVSNEALQIVRRTKRAERLQARLAKEEDRSPDPVEMVETNEVRRQVAAAVAALPAPERAAVTLRYLHDLDEKTVAESLGWPLGTVKTRLHRARLRLRGKLLALAIAVIALVAATVVAFATGVVHLPTRAIVQKPAAAWQQDFSQQHHGTTGKGSAGPAQGGTLADVQRQAGFHVHTLSGVAGAELTNATWSTVTFRDGSTEPEVVLEYRVGDFILGVVELKDKNPAAPYEVPTVQHGYVQTIDGAQYLFATDGTGSVTDVQFKATDGVIFSVNFYGPRYPNASGPGGASRQFATNVVLQLA